MPDALTDEEISEGLARLPGWRHEGGEISKWYKFEGFPQAAAFIQRLVEPSERLNHHPDLECHERRVRVALHTWSEEAVTEKDLALAEEVERVAAEG
jgi:4a-hydroxytetrahydrobiopterin dehydratase